MAELYKRTVAAVETSTPVFLWEVPEKPLSVRVDVEMIDRLAKEVTAVVRSLTARGSEVGGILLGRVDRGTSRITLQEYRTIPCDYARGPLFRLDTPDVERFAAAIQEQENAGDGMKVLGYFRSNTRPGLLLEEEEVDFCRTHFGHAHQIALLIRPQRGSQSMAGIFIWEDGQMRRDASYLEFPCSAADLLPLCGADASGDAAPEPVQNAEAEPEPAPKIQFRRVEPENSTWLKPQLEPQEAEPLITEEEPSPIADDDVPSRPEPAPSTAPPRIIQIASRRKVAPFPAAPAARPAEEMPARDPELDNPGKPTRVGRCSMRVELRPAGRRNASGSPRERPGGTPGSRKS